MFALPPRIRSAFSDGSWPSGWIETTRLVKAAPFLSGVRLELIQSLADIENGSGGPWGSVLPSVARSWERDHLGRGSLGTVPDLPWLDIEQCLPFGGGYFGDDVWLVLDYRPGPNHPRIVANEFVGLKTGLEVLWRQLAPSFDQFWYIIQQA